MSSRAVADLARSPVATPSALPRPSPVLLGVVLALLGWLLAGTSPAAAQDRWAVKCDYGEERPLSGSRILETCRDPVASETAFVDTLLEDATEWLLGLGFAEPVIETAEDGDGRYRAQVIVRESDAADMDVVDISSDAMANYTRHPAAEGIVTSAPRMFLKGWDLTVPDDVRQAEGEQATEALDEMATPVHELFHAVQGGEMGDLSGYESLSEGTTGGWIAEGSAEAVALAYLRERNPVEGVAAPEPWTRYDKPLTDEDYAYNTAHFWLSVGEELGSTDRIRYLRSILDPDRDFGDRGLAGVHQGLREHHDEGLYDLYPEVVARHAADRTYYEGGEEAIKEIEMELIAAPDVTRSGQVEAVAAEAWLLRTGVPEGETAGLVVELPEELRDDRELHLIVGDERQDRPASPEDDRNVYRKAIGHEETEFLVRLANVAPSPDQTRERDYSVRFALEPLEPCAAIALMAALSPRLTELDRLVQAEAGGAAAAMSPVPAFSSPEHNPFRQWRTYEEETRERGLMPAEGEMRFSGAVNAGGTTCVDPIGDNPVVDMLVGVWDEAELERRMMERMQEMTPEEAMRMQREQDLDPQSKDVFERMWGIEVPPFLNAVLGDMGGSAIVQVYSPNGYSWILGHTPPPPDFLDHSGIGGWPANAAAQLTIVVPGTPVSELEEGETYEATTFAPEGSDIPLYSSWSGEWTTAAAQQRHCETGLMGGVEPAGPADDVRSPFPDAFTGLWKEVAGVLHGTITVEEITGAEVIGTFELEGEVQVRRTTYEYEWADDDMERCEYERSGVVIGDRATDTDETEEGISVSGEFQAPAAVEVGRDGRLITTTRSVSRR